MTISVLGVEPVLNKGKVGENYNICGHNEWHNIDIVKLVCQLMGEAFAGDKTLSERFPNATKAAAGASTKLITFVKNRPGHDRRYAIDATKSCQSLGICRRSRSRRGFVRLCNGISATRTGGVG